MSHPLVSFLGPEGTFCHAAALRHFDAKAALRPAPSIPAVFDALEAGSVHYGVVPVENSIEGGVTFTQDRLLESAQSVCAEVIISIEQCLLSNAASLADVERIVSHPQGLAQCRKWVHRHLPEAQLVPAPSTARAAQLVQDDPHAAAIASELAGEIFSVRLVARSIQDTEYNATRFLVLGSELPGPSGKDKTSLAFSTRHERGALVNALQVFNLEQINLCRIESRPGSGSSWEYVFFVDLEGHRDDPSVARALQRLQAHTEMIRVFGSYPKATTA